MKEENWLLHPAWELYETWLIFYDTLPVDIPSIDSKANKSPLRPRAYQYLENLDILPNKDTNSMAYKSIIDNFLKSGIRIVDLHYDTLNNIQQFGAKNAFFEEDKLLMIDWCQAIISIFNRY